MTDNCDFAKAVNSLSELITEHVNSLTSSSLLVTANLTTPPPLPALPNVGLGTSETLNHIRSTILPNLAQGHAGPRYFGFVTGGSTPAALLADYLVSTYDQNVQVHLPQSISTVVERQTIHMLCELLDLQGFKGTFTTGATAGNIIGLATGREKTILTVSGERVSQIGGGDVDVTVLCAGGHSSISKACSILGIGRRNCVDLTAEEEPASFDIQRLRVYLEDNEQNQRGSIIVATFGEVNTGAFPSDMQLLSGLRDEFENTWLHVDAAFGVLARIHPLYSALARGLELADSISFDGHKFFNVPYDCGVFLTRDMATVKHVCGNTNAAYLLSAGDEEPSPLDISLENSRRFRALPLYASLLSLGREGYVDIVMRCCALAEAIGKKIEKSPKFRLLWRVEFNVVLFQARGYESLESNIRLRDSINATGKIYLSSTIWNDEPGLRIAICNHLTTSKSDAEARFIVSLLEQQASNAI